MTAVIITGGIDLSVGSVLCLTGMVTGMMMHADYSIWVAVPAGLAAAALDVAATSGVLIAYVGMPPFVVTLGMMSLARSLAMVMSNNTMVFDFGRDHAKFLALGGGSTRGLVPADRQLGRDPTRRSASFRHWLATLHQHPKSGGRPRAFSRWSSVSLSAGRAGAGTSSRSAVTNRRRS